MLTVNLDKSLVFVIVRCYFLNLFPFNFVFSRGGQGPPLELPGGGKRTTAPPMYATGIINIIIIIFIIITVFVIQMTFFQNSKYFSIKVQSWSNNWTKLAEIFLREQARSYGAGHRCTCPLPLYPRRTIYEKKKKKMQRRKRKMIERRKKGRFA